MKKKKIKEELKEFQIKSFGCVDEKISVIEKELEKVSRFKSWQQEILLRNQKIELEKDWKHLMKERESCEKLKKVVIEARNEILQNLIENFNHVVEEILSYLFDDIAIELDMFKVSKNSKEVKPHFNIKIVLRGLEYDNISLLSGGEKDRVSIALTIALNVISKSNILILDEPMASLDESMREKCLEVIKKFSKNKIILNVCHTITEGYYDNVIEI